MTNEELKKLIEKYDKEVNKLFQENKKLKSKIDKAIEYIEQDYDKNQEIIEYCNFEDFYKRLSKILKGEENE